MVFVQMSRFVFNRSLKPSICCPKRGLAVTSTRYTVEKFSKDHEWIRVIDGIGTVGLTKYAVEELGDVVYVALPEVDISYSQGDACAVVESVKAASDIYAPVSGLVTAVNTTLESSPETLNASPTEDGWLFKIKLSKESETDELMDEDAYNKSIE